MPSSDWPGGGEDLGQARGGRRVAAGDHLRSARALHEHDRLEQVRGDPGAGGGAVDQRPQRGHARGGGQRPPGLLTNSGWALPAVARAAKSASMAGTYRKMSPWPAPGPGSARGGGGSAPPAGP